MACWLAADLEFPPHPTQGLKLNLAFWRVPAGSRPICGTCSGAPAPRRPAQCLPAAAGSTAARPAHRHFPFPLPSLAPPSETAALPPPDRQRRATPRSRAGAAAAGRRPTPGRRARLRSLRTPLLPAPAADRRRRAQRRAAGAAPDGRPACSAPCSHYIPSHTLLLPCDSILLPASEPRGARSCVRPGQLRLPHQPHNGSPAPGGLPRRRARPTARPGKGEGRPPRGAPSFPPPPAARPPSRPAAVPPCV
jgi:hypothetical protein